MALPPAATAMHVACRGLGKPVDLLMCSPSRAMGLLCWGHSPPPTGRPGLVQQSPCQTQEHNGHTSQLSSYRHQQTACHGAGLVTHSARDSVRHDETGDAPHSITGWEGSESKDCWQAASHPDLNPPHSTTSQTWLGLCTQLQLAGLTYQR